MSWLTLFLIGAGFCVYTLFGYPLLLALVAKWRGKPIRKAPFLSTVTVILPVYNGQSWIAAKLESILALHYPRELLEILVISDGCTDSTMEIARGFAPLANLHCIELPRGGKATALNAGLERATGDILFFTDVRQQLDPESLANLVACFSDARVGVASGELIIREGAGTEEASVGLYWKYEKWIRTRLSRIDSVMGATGCIYAMRRELAVPLPPNTLVDDMYLPLSAFFRGYRIVLDQTALAFDHPTQLASEFRRKVRTLAGVYQVIAQFPALLGARNRMWIHFMSHKLARLLMPWALLLALVASFGLPGPYRAWALAAQAAGYGLAVVDPLVGERTALKRLTSPLRTFVVLMGAALCAVSILFVPAQLLWGQTSVAATASPGAASGKSS